LIKRRVKSFDETVHFRRIAMQKAMITSALAVSMIASTAALADGGFGYKASGYNYGTFATGTSGAAGTADVTNGYSVDNESQTFAYAALSNGGCGCNSGATIASDSSGAQNIISTSGGTSDLQSTTASTSSAGVGYGAGGSSGHAGHH
jgi:hypothetical protein